MIKVLCGGRFNFPHKGHEYFLREAKKQGDYLIVVIAHDSHNKKNNKPIDEGKKENLKIADKIINRKIVEMEKRKENLDKLGIADEVVIGDSEDFFKVVEKYRPNIIALGWDQKLPFEEKKLVNLGISIVKIDKMD